MSPKHRAAIEARVIVALDFNNAEAALAFAARVRPSDCKLKIGLELFTAAGPDIVRRLVDRGFDIFLDLKFHDIPNTVAMACQQAAQLGVWMLNVHALGGADMLQAAAASVRAMDKPPWLIAVTVLTSHAADAFRGIGVVADLPQTAAALARLSRTAGLDGVVCSGHEAAALRAAHGPEFLLVTPGIRTAAAAADDQMRVMTPAQAVCAGADYLVIGRPITRAADPLAALAAANAEVAAAG